MAGRDAATLLGSALRQLTVFVTAMCVFAGHAAASDYQLRERGGATYIAASGVEYELIEQRRLSEFGFSDALQVGAGVGEGLGDAARGLLCFYTLGLVRGEAQVQRFAFQGFISRRIPGIAAIHLRGADYGYVGVIGDRAAVGVNAFVPNRIMAEFEQVAVESETGLFRDLKAVFLMERRREDCGSTREYFIIDYIPLDESFDAAPIFSDAADKLAFAYEICRRARRCP